MSQEILFFLFMLVELSAILLLYQLVIIPRIALKTNNLFEERMLDKSWDIPAMLEDYTIHLSEVFTIKTLGARSRAIGQPWVWRLQAGVYWYDHTVNR